jgi:tetratricopeptide (TPR) repeat protein
MKVRTLAALLAGLSFARFAAAQTPEDLSRSRELFRAGASAYAAGDYAAAIQALERAYELTPLPAIAFSLAQAERKQYLTSGDTPHLERAVSLFRRYLEEAPSGNRRADALDALAQLEPRLPRKPEVEKVAPTRPTRLLIVVEAPGARISLDDAPGSPSPLIREVSAGKHRLRATAPGFLPAERDAIAVPGELIFTELRLEERPVALHVYTPNNSEVYVDGAFAGESPGVLALALPSGEHDIAVRAQGRRLGEQRVRLVRGQPLAIRISPELSVQRVVSMSLLCAAGAAAGASVVLSAFAVRSENSAENFLGARAHHTVSSAQLAAYQASVNERDRFRFAAGLGFASAAGLFVTGLFLHELDRPSAPERKASAQPQSANNAYRSLAVLPVSPTGVAGATLLLQF